MHSLNYFSHEMLIKSLETLYYQCVSNWAIYQKNRFKLFLMFIYYVFLMKYLNKYTLK